MSQKHWQNLIYRNCPKCGASLVEKNRTLYVCSDDETCFGITAKNYYKILTDEEHIMRKFLTDQERIDLYILINPMI